jgi:hypothetical protein
MNILMNCDLDSCIASISAESTLTEVSFAVEAAACHFLGRGVNRFDCTRTREEKGTCVLKFKALKKSGPMQISKVGSIGSAVESGLIPRKIPANEKFQLEESGFQKIVTEGQHKHGGPRLASRKQDGSTCTSIIESHDLRPELPLSILSYGLGDMFTGLFALNCHYVKWQVSLDTIQLYIRHNLSDERLAKFLLSNADYVIDQKVSALS